MIFIIEKINITELIAVLGMVVMGVYGVINSDPQSTNIVIGGLLGWLGRGALHAGNNTK